MAEKILKENIMNAMRELGAQQAFHQKYMREYKPPGVTRKRRMTPEMTRILKYSIDECAYGLKSHWNAEEIRRKLPCLNDDFTSLGRPKVIEIYLRAGDLENHRNGIDSCIETLNGIPNLYVSIHEPLPLEYKGKPLDMSTGKKVCLENTMECLRTLCDICEENKILGFVAHPSSNKSSRDNFRTLMRNLRRVDDRIKDKMFLENISNFHTTDRIKEAYNAGCEICYDVAHGQILLGTEDLKESVRELGPIVKYWHFSDVLGDRHGLEFCRGTVPWKDILPFTEGIIISEIRSRDEMRPLEMIMSMHSIEFSKCMVQTNNVREILKKNDVEV
jgi:hypothetical protein